MYVRFGGRSAETCCRKAVRRRKPSLLIFKLPNDDNVLKTDSVIKSIEE